MTSQMRPTLLAFVLLTLLTGIAYPLIVTAIAVLVFPVQAGGSLIQRQGVTVGSSLIGQSFGGARYFWSRPSATSPTPYNAAASSASNLGPLNPALLAAVTARADALRALDPDNTTPIPLDLVTSSGSGLDPHISPAAAAWQRARVARARGRAISDVQACIDACTQGRQWGLLGEQRVNVLCVNLALDSRAQSSQN